MALIEKRATRALIHYENLLYNIHLVKKIIGAKRKICFPVKANGYGHGSAEIGAYAVEAGVDCLSVATLQEGRELRDAGITVPILLLGHVLPEELEYLISYNLTPIAGSLEYLEVLEKRAAIADSIIPLHLKVDTGMSRMGCRLEDAESLVRFIVDSNALELRGICTHFPVSDSCIQADIDFTQNQIEIFETLIGHLHAEGFDTGLVHAANSGGLALHPDSWFDMVRPGLALYGYEPVPRYPLKVKPVMELNSKVILMKKLKKGESVSYGRRWTAPDDTLVGVLPVGYADGINRSLSQKLRILIKGKRYPQVGTICMDQMMVDLGPDPDVRLYDDAIVFGPDPEGNSAADLAKMLDTIPYEITCGINVRVPRIKA